MNFHHLFDILPGLHIRQHYNLLAPATWERKSNGNISSYFLKSIQMITGSRIMIVFYYTSVDKHISIFIFLPGGGTVEPAGGNAEVPVGT